MLKPGGAVFVAWFGGPLMVMSCRGVIFILSFRMTVNAIEPRLADHVADAI